MAAVDSIISRDPQASQEVDVLSRRRLIELMVAGALVASLPAAAAAAVEEPPQYLFFTSPEVAFIEAAMSRIIPTDDLGPGAADAGGVVFLDRQLVGDYGVSARTYMQGPFGATTPYQGYQLQLTVAQVYRVAIAAVDLHCKETLGAVFADLKPADQDAVLRQLLDVSSRLELAEVPGSMFGAMLLQDTRDSFFADPVHGGNRDASGWKLVGYPGPHGFYQDVIFKQGVGDAPTASNVSHAMAHPVGHRND